MVRRNEIQRYRAARGGGMAVAATAGRLAGRYALSAMKRAMKRPRAATRSTRNTRRRTTVRRTGGAYSTVRKKIVRRRPRAQIMRMNNRLMFAQYVNQYKRMGNYESSIGSVVLRKLEATELPMCVFCINGVRNQSQDLFVTKKYNTSTGLFENFFSTSSNNVANSVVQPIGTIGGLANPIKKAIFQRFRAKILLYGCPKRSMRYRITILKANKYFDPEYEPDDTKNPQNSDQVSEQSNAIRNYLDDLVTHPCTQTPAVNRNKLNIVWSKDYVMQEQLSTEDSIQKRMVDISKVVNQFTSYMHADRTGAAFQAEDLELTYYQTNDSMSKTIPVNKAARYYMIVAAGETLDSTGAESELSTFGGQSPSFDVDIVMRHKILDP